MMNPYSEALNYKVIRNTPAQTRIKAAFLPLYRSRGLSDITVRKICEEAHVARSTFYAYYVDEVLADFEDEFLGNQMLINQSLLSMKDITAETLAFCDAVVEHIDENRDLLKTMLVVHPDFRFYLKWKMEIKYLFWERFFRGKQVVNEKLKLETISSVLISAYVFYLRYPEEVDIGDVKATTVTTFQLLDQE